MGIYKLKYFMNCIKVKRNNLLNSIYSSVSPDRWKWCITIFWSGVSGIISEGELFQLFVKYDTVAKSFNNNKNKSSHYVQFLKLKHSATNQTWRENRLALGTQGKVSWFLYIIYSIYNNKGNNSIEILSTRSRNKSFFTINGKKHSVTHIRPKHCIALLENSLFCKLQSIISPFIWSWLNKLANIIILFQLHALVDHFNGM